MWLARNGSLAYYSLKGDRILVYYTTHDICRATFSKIPNQESKKPWTFQVVLPPHDGVEEAPGQFAAESEDAQNRWISELIKSATGHQESDADDFFSLFACCTS